MKDQQHNYSHSTSSSSFKSFFEIHLKTIHWMKDGKGKALCPFHDDRNPSLSIEAEMGLWFCHACRIGGTASDLAKRLKVSAPQKDRKSPIANYVYTNEKGDPIFRVLRGEDKKFWVERYLGDGQWEKGMGDLKPVPYRLHEIVNSNDIIFIVEGEKDVETLRDLGLVATTNPFGAGKWSPDFNKYFKGRDVVLHPDNDSPGHSHMEEVAKHLFPIVNSLKLIPLPGLKEKEDVTDWVKSGHSEDELMELVGESQYQWSPEKNDGSKDYSCPFTQRERSSWPSPLAKEAFYGVAGEFVKIVEPQTEADPVALLIQILTAAGNAIGSNPFFPVEADRHRLKIFPVLVGETSKGRKGTSTGYMKYIFGQIDSDWTQGCIKSGLSSGEGLIWQVRDEIKRTDPIKEKGRVTGYQEIIVDPGIEDKRLLIIEPEFASTLRVIGRDGNTLSPTIRQAWDGESLRVLTKNSPAQATGVHISIIAHISCDELKRYLDRTEIGNGFANRFIFLCVRRSKILPEGGQLYGLNLESMQTKLQEAVKFGKMVNEVRRDGKATQIWADVYPELSAGKPGLLGAVISRAEAQVTRIACIYALLDKSTFVRAEHLKAALALWNYSEASARYIFGDATGDFVADRILQASRGLLNGLTRTEIRDLFFRNVSGEKIDLSLLFLESHGLIRMVKEDTGGRPTERWVVI